MITLKPGDTFAEHYRLIKLVDVGGFAEVWEAVFTGETVALKIFPRLNEEGIEKVKSEFRQSVLLHTHLIVPSYFGVCEGQPYLVMRFCRGGNAGEKTGDCNEADIAKMMYQVGSALAYLHTKEIIHQDIKPNNILLDEDGNYYLTDLGLSIKLRQAIQKYTQVKSSDTVPMGKTTPNRTTTGITPPCYRGPELYENPQSPEPVMATDIWAFGASLFEMADGNVPLGEWGGMIQMNNPEPPDLPGKFSPQLNNIIKACLSKITWNRPKASELSEWAGYYIRYNSWPPESQPPPEQVIVPRNEVIKDRAPWRKILLILLVAFVAGGFAWGLYTFLHKPESAVVLPEHKPNATDTSSSKDAAMARKEGNNTTVKDSVEKVAVSQKKKPGIQKQEPVKKAKDGDSDGDGVPNSKDECPTENGPASNAGCPTNSH